MPGTPANQTQSTTAEGKTPSESHGCTVERHDGMRCGMCHDTTGRTWNGW